MSNKYAIDSYHKLSKSKFKWQIYYFYVPDIVGTSILSLDTDIQFQVIYYKYCDSYSG